MISARNKSTRGSDVAKRPCHRMLTVLDLVYPPRGVENRGPIFTTMPPLLLQSLSFRVWRRLAEKGCR